MVRNKKLEGVVDAGQVYGGSAYIYWPSHGLHMRPLVPAFQAQEANTPKWTSFSALHGKLKIHAQLIST